MAWTTPRTWVATETVTASLLNTHLRDNLSDLQARLTGAGTSFTLTTGGSTNITIGNATQANSWKLLSEKFAFFRLNLILGSTSSVAGIFALGPLPFTLAGTDAQAATVYCNDVSASNRWGGTAWLNGTQVFRIFVVDGAGGASNISPFTWTTGDWLVVQGVAEIT